MKDLILPICLLFTLAFSEADAENPSGTKIQTLIWPDGTRYVGGVLNGKRSGKGTIFWKDGTRYVGHFEDDLRNGSGTMILPDGTVYTGFFKNDEIIDTEADTTAFLGDTELPMEADSLSRLPPSKKSEYSEDIQTADKLNATSSSTFTESLDRTDNSLISSLNPSRKETLPTKMKSVDDSVKQELVNTIDLWAAAWSDQDVTQYLSYYSKDFKAPAKKSRKAWERMRRTRLTKPSYIDLNIDYQNFELVDSGLVEVFLQQTYHSNTYRDSIDKVLKMQKEGTEWKIILESTR